MEKREKNGLKKKTVFVFKNLKKNYSGNTTEPTTYPTTTVTTTDPTISAI